MLAYCGQYREWTFGIYRKMNEQRIVDYLKKNKHVGVCVAYMPEAVVAWIDSHRQDMLIMNNHIGYGFRVRPNDIEEWWKKYDEHNENTEIYSHSIVALPDSYKLKKG